MNQITEANVQRCTNNRLEAQRLRKEIKKDLLGIKWGHVYTEPRKDGVYRMKFFNMNDEDLNRLSKFLDIKYPGLYKEKLVAFWYGYKSLAVFIK